MSFVDPATPVGLGLLHLARPWLPSQHGRRVIERGQDRTYDSVRQLVHDVAYPTQPPLQTPCRLAVTLNFVVATARAIAELKAAPRGAVAVPTLVIISSNDNVIDAPTCARRAERLCGGECTVVDVPAAGHNVYSLVSEARLCALYDLLGAFWDGEAVRPHAGRLGRVVQDRRAKSHA